jgi:hypothetical protein
MKRRLFVQTLTALPAATSLAAQQPAAPVTPANRAAAADDVPKLDVAVGEAVADPAPRFFTPAQFGALRRVSDLLAPAAGNSPGALAAGAPEFLDFLIGASGPDRQTVYKAGLDGLNTQATRRFNKPFADLDNPPAESLLAPLRQPWTYDEPADPVARFLRVAKADVRTATLNSRLAAGAGRRFAGSGLYWYPLD